MLKLHKRTNHFLSFRSIKSLLGTNDLFKTELSHFHILVFIVHVSELLVEVFNKGMIFIAIKVFDVLLNGGSKEFNSFRHLAFVD